MTKMKYRPRDAAISLDDPERGFSFTHLTGQTALTYRDWLNTSVTIAFVGVVKFSYSHFPPYPELPEGTFCEILDSEYISQLREAKELGENEAIHHFLISTNEDEWCEVVAKTYEVS